MGQVWGSYVKFFQINIIVLNSFFRVGPIQV